MRAFAIIAIVLYHLDSGIAPAGLLGVDMFFVLSGYLITCSLAGEWHRKKSIDLKRFWIHRLRRIYPAALALIPCVILLCALFSHPMLTKMRPDIAPSLLFFSNWWYIFRNVSYFAALGSPSPIKHFWFLAIQMQFYLVWPLILMVLFKGGIDHVHIRRGILVAALLSAVEMAILFNPAGDPSRAYFGTDTRAFSLLLGCWLGFAWPWRRLASEKVYRLPGPSARTLDLCGACAIVGLVAMMLLANGYNPFLYRGGFLLADILTVVLIAALVHPESILAHAFSAKPLKWLGERSYSLYLWHFPIFLLMTNRNSTVAQPWWLYVLKLGVALGCACLSYQFVEQRTSHGEIGAFVKGIREGKDTLPAFARRFTAPVASVGAVIVAAMLCLAFVPDAGPLQNSSQALPSGSTGQGASAMSTSQGNAGGSATGASAGSTTSGSSTGDSAAGSQTTSTSTQAQPAETAYTEDQSPVGKPPDDEDGWDHSTPEAGVSNVAVLLIGDSVSETTKYRFYDYFPNGQLDARIGRQLFVGKAIYEAYVAQGHSGDVVVYCLGSNGPFDSDTIDSIIDCVDSGKPIYFVNNRMPDDFQDQNNALIDECANRHANMQVIDWHGASEGHDEYFDGDGEHLTPTGVNAYLSLIESYTG